MADWKKIIVSGSQAELAGVTGSFTGSFFGDGSGLTGVSSFSVSGDVNNRVITADGSGGGVGEPNLTFDGNTLGVTGTVFVDSLGGISGSSDTIHLGNYNNDNINSKINGHAGDHYILQSDGAIEINHPIIKLTGIPTGTDNSVVIWNGTTLATDEIDPRVWGTTLVDAANGADNRIATFSDADSLNGEENLTFDGGRLAVTGIIAASSTITGSGAQLTSVPAGTDNTVLIVDNSGNVLRDEIDPRVWGATLVDGSGLATNYVTFASDADTITGASDFTYTSGTKTLSVTNATITGDLTVTGTVTELQITNLNIEDQFILLNSGSGEPLDTGIVFGGVQDGTTGAALFWNVDATRLAYTNTGIAWNATEATPSGYLTIAYNIDGGQTAEAYVGNIKIEGGEPFIYV